MELTGSPVRAACRALFVGASCVAAFASCAKETSPVGPDPATEYVLEVRYLGAAPTGTVATAFANAANAIRATIVGPLAPVAIPNNFDIADCNADDPNLEGFPTVPDAFIQGLVIYVQIRPMDGVGGVLGSAGPCLVRSAAHDHLTALGLMKFDQDDVNARTEEVLTKIVLHEMLHVVGFGTIWETQGIVDVSDLGDARFEGPAARTACETTHAGGPECAVTVPVHSTDGAGSAYAHWRESFFTTELMTPFLDADLTPFSEMTIRSLQDLGYVVSTAPAQAYTVSGTAVRAQSSGAAPLRMPEPMRPRFEMDDAGRVTTFRGRR